MLNVSVGKPAFSERDCTFANHAFAIESPHRETEQLRATRQKAAMQLADKRLRYPSARVKEYFALGTFNAGLYQTKSGHIRTLSERRDGHRSD